MRVFENMVVRKIVGADREELTRYWRFHKERP
jgi:hypothetical protein